MQVVYFGSVLVNVYRGSIVEGVSWWMSAGVLLLGLCLGRVLQGFYFGGGVLEGFCRGSIVGAVSWKGSAEVTFLQGMQQKRLLLFTFLSVPKYKRHEDETPKRANVFFRIMIMMCTDVK